MRLETRKLLEDIRQAATQVRAFVGDSDFAMYADTH